MQIFTKHASVGLQTKYKTIWTKNGIFGLVTRRPTWARLTGQWIFQNHQISMQILTQHAAVGLQTKFEANRTKNSIFGLGIRRPAWARWIFEIAKIYADSYSACCSSPINQI